MTDPPAFTNAVPPRAGIGLKALHYREILDSGPEIGWFEVHAENYMCDGGPPHRYLEAIRSRYPLSLHSVGCSLGGAEMPDTGHLERLAHLVDRYEPGLVSDHLSWSALNGVYYNDLLPIPYTEESLDIVCRNVDAMQTCLGRRILVENPSTYVQFRASAVPEPEFLMELARRTGCGLLLDVNNVYVSACNHGFDARAYLSVIDENTVGEIHLAGHSLSRRNGCELRVDDHGSAVADEVWTLYAETVVRMPHVPVLVEWDTNIPTLDVWLGEAAKAERLARRNRTVGPHAALA